MNKCRFLQLITLSYIISVSYLINILLLTILKWLTVLVQRVNLSFIFCPIFLKIYSLSFFRYLYMILNICDPAILTICVLKTVSDFTVAQLSYVNFDRTQ